MRQSWMVRHITTRSCDLFKGAPFKQVFATDDVQTMQWIQTLSDKKTILTKTRNSNHSHLEQKTHTFRGTPQEEGKNIQETGADLIPLDKIRQMPSNEQLIFLHGAQPIRCKKVHYLKENLIRIRWKQGNRFSV